MTEISSAPYTTSAPRVDPAAPTGAPRWVKVWWVLFCFFALGFAVMLACRNLPFAVCAESLLRRHFRNADGFLAGCAQAAGVLSLGSVVISLILRNLDQQTLGIPLRDLVAGYFPGYYFVFAATIAAALLCVGTAHWGKLAATLPLLFVILLCCWIHLLVLRMFIFRSSVRRDRALREWERRIAAAAKPEEAVELSYGISNAVMAEPQPYNSPRPGGETERSIYRCFARALRRAEVLSRSNRMQATEYMRAAWLYILRLDPPQEKLLFLLKSALRTAEGEGEPPDRQAVATALLGFFCGLYEAAMEEADRKGRGTERLMDLQVRIAELCGNMEPYDETSWRYLYGAYALAVLMRRQMGLLDSLPRALLNYLPLGGDDPVPGGDKPQFEDAFRALLGEADVRAHFPRCAVMLANMERALGRRRGTR